MLRGLLDGYPGFFVSPNHDMIIDTMCNFENNLWLEYKDTMYLRTLLCNTYYYQLEHISNKKAMEYDMSTLDRCNFDIDFDFYKFDKMVIKKLIKESKWTRQVLVEHIFSSMKECWNNYSFDKDEVQNYVGMGFDMPKTAENFVKYFPNGKMIYIMRSIEGIIAVRSNRRPVDDDMRSLCLLETTPEKLVVENHVRKLIKKQKYMQKQALLYPDKIMLINFDYLIENTEIIMSQICEFLNIEFNEILLKCTVSGHEMITESGQKYIGKILDNPDKLLNEYQKVLIDVDKSLKNIFKIKNLKHPKALLDILVIKWFRILKLIRYALASLLLCKNIFKMKEQWKRDGFF